MPSYNQADYVEEAINSVLSQSYDNIELIVLDALSTDGTIEKLNRFKDHPSVKILVEADKGQSDALAKGFRLATGDILAWLNSDDVFLPGCFELVASRFMHDDRIDVINGETIVINSQSQFIDLWPRRKISNKAWLHYPQTIAQPSTFFRASLYRRVGGINSDLHFAMDYELFFKFALNGARIHFVDEKLAGFRTHGASKTMALPYKFWKEELRVFYNLSGKKLFSLFYYWKFRGIVSTIIKKEILKTRKY